MQFYSAAFGRGPQMKIRKLRLSVPVLTLILLSWAAPTYGLEDPRWDRSGLNSEPTSLGALESWNDAPSWSQRFFRVEIPELKRPLTFLPEPVRSPTLFQRWHRDLLNLPFRPTQIGHKPTLPKDPQTGLGLVLRLPFSL